MVTVTDLQVVLRGDASGVQNAIRTADSQVTGFTGRTRNRLSQVYSAFQMVGLGVLGVGAASVGVAIEFESSFADVRKTVNGTDEELEALETRIRDMATDESNPLSAIENSQNALAGIAAMGGQLGITLDEMESFIQTVGNLDVATNLSADQIGEMLARYANVADLDASEFDNFGDALVTLGNNMAAQESDIAATLSYIQQLSTMGFDTTEVLAYAAALPSLGITPEAGGSALVQTVTQLTSLLGNEGDRLDLAEWLQLDPEDELNINNITASLENMLLAYNNLSAVEQIQFLEEFGMDGIRQQRLINSLAAGMDTLDSALLLSEEGFAGNAAAMTEASAKAGTSQGNINEMINSLRELGITLGETLLPTLNDAVDSFTELIQIADEEGLGEAIRTGLEQGAQALADAIGLDTNISEGWEALANGIEMAAEVAVIVLDRAKRGIERWVLDVRMRVADFIGGMRQMVLDASGGSLDIAPDINFEFSDVQSRLAALDAVDQFTSALQSQINAGDINLADIMIGSGDFSISADNSVAFDPESLGFDATAFGAESKMKIEDALRTALVEGDAISVEALTDLAMALEIDVDAVEADAAAILEAETYNATVNMTLWPGTIDVSRVGQAVSGSLAGVGGGLGGGLQGPVPPPSGGGDTIVVNSYGQSPYALAEQMQSAQRSMGN